MKQQSNTHEKCSLFQSKKKTINKTKLFLEITFRLLCLMSRVRQSTNSFHFINVSDTNHCHSTIASLPAKLLIRIMSRVPPFIGYWYDSYWNHLKVWGLTPFLIKYAKLVTLSYTQKYNLKIFFKQQEGSDH